MKDTHSKILQQLSVIKADCADCLSYPGCDQLTVGEAERLLENVKLLAALRSWDATVIQKVMNAEKCSVERANEIIGGQALANPAKTG